MKNNKRRHYICFIIISFLLVAIIFVMVGFNKTLQSLPKRVCHSEYKVHKIIVGCGFTLKYIPANVERICEEGVEGATEKLNYDNIVYDCKRDSTQKICLYKEEIQKCEII